MRHDDLEGRVAMHPPKAKAPAEASHSEATTGAELGPSVSVDSVAQAQFPDDVAVWTPQWCTRVLKTIDEAKKPVIVHCQTGVAACAAGLIRSARLLKASPRQVITWGNSLGHNLTSHADLEMCISELVTS